MQHQYWVTKKSVLRKLGGKEDECIISSDAELDAKLELFKSINDSCVQLQRVIDLYQERLCCLAQEENTLGRYLKECGKKEKNTNAAQIMATAGKALAYTGHQRLTIRPPLVRLHHEVDTFRNRAVSDTRSTVGEMEKVRTEYRGALSWMKAASSQLDPDSGMGLERFRKAQSYVKSSKTKFDRFTLACLQKVDLLAAARCNMFSHALIPYQNALAQFSAKADETLRAANTKLNNIEEGNCETIPEITLDKDKSTFFKSDYSDKESSPKTETSNLLGEDFSNSTNLVEEDKSDLQKPSSELLDLNWTTSSDFLGGDFMPSKLLQENTFDFSQFGFEFEKSTEEKPKIAENDGTLNNGTNQVSWLSLFAELDPLSNSGLTDCNSGDRA